MKNYDLYSLLLGLACTKGSFTVNEAFEYVEKIDPDIEPAYVYRAIDELAIRDMVIPKDDGYKLSV